MVLSFVIVFADKKKTLAGSVLCGVIEKFYGGDDVMGH